MKRKKQAIVLGAGFIGSTIALCAKSAGYEVQIITEQQIKPADSNSDPRFASAYPAASILPHFSASEDNFRLMQDGQAVFAEIQKHADTGVRSQRHFDLWEEPFTQDLPYLKHCQDYQDIGGFTDIALPKRAGAQGLYGYGLTIFFADMPTYGKWIKKQIEEQDIKIIHQKLTSGSVADLKADIIFNCLGIGAPHVFPELGPGFVMRGILLRFPCDDIYAERNTKRPVSYNYIPEKNVYPSPDSNPWDLYFFPRQTSIIIGGTRQIMIMDPDTGEVSGPSYPGETFSYHGIDIPKPILDLNRELILQMTGRALPETFEPLVGYRHLYGTPDKPELLIKARDTGYAPMIDCLGFGGSGVTLSWGTAKRALEIAMPITGQLDSAGDLGKNLFGFLKGTPANSAEALAPQTA